MTQRPLARTGTVCSLGCAARTQSASSSWLNWVHRDATRGAPLTPGSEKVKTLSNETGDRLDRTTFFAKIDAKI